MRSRAFVANASPLILLVRAEQIEILRALADRVAVPEAVLSELCAGADRDDSATVVESQDWLDVVPDVPLPAGVQAWDLDAGESQVVAYALAHAGYEAVLDDRAGRRCARSLAVPTVGTLGLVLAAKRISAIEQARPVVEKLRSCGLYLSDAVLDAALAEVGE